MTLIKISATKWNGNGFGNSSAGWTIKGKTDWYITSRNGDWIAINQMTGKAGSLDTPETFCLKRLQLSSNKKPETL
jgi:hypothetical protein